MLVVFVAPSLSVLAYSAEVTLAKSYQDVISHLCGPVIGKSCQLCISVAAFGAGVGQLILIGDQLIDSMNIIVFNISQTLNSD